MYLYMPLSPVWRAAVCPFTHLTNLRKVVDFSHCLIFCLLGQSGDLSDFTGFKTFKSIFFLRFIHLFERKKERISKRVCARGGAEGE